MNKRKQKQMRRLLAAKRTEKCGQNSLQIEMKKLRANVWDLAVQSQETANRLKSQGETLRLCNRFFVKEIANLENRITTDRIGDVLLAIIGGMIGGAIAMVTWILCLI
ncbi:hypothetical protein [Rodentibacter haemolyticus]|uniref:Uncharacterized protein n=1 Tax=Rodentibacter haemolyticus TaxID=2778911 RepID=A0ABX6V0B6_9PAST|nr:hypothetical protein [Rodentibacter haemolyticus]QPB43053.1 hypothetical protein IHV77_02745 [Rodentibacter haemolyticus]